MADDSSPTIGPPRLAHLLLWTFWSAAIFALIRVRWQSDAITSPATIPAVYGVLDGGILTGLCIVLWYWRSRRGYLVPGHWVLLAKGAYVVALEALTAVLFSGIRVSDFPMWVWWMFTLLPWICAACVYGFAAMRVREQHWSVCFALLSFSVILAHILLFPRAAHAVEAVGLLIMIILDSLWRIRRDWLHWLGMTLVLVTSLGYVGLWLHYIWVS